MPIPFHLRRRVAAFFLISPLLAALSAAQTPAPPAWALAETARLTYEGEINRRAVAAGPRIYFTTRRGWIYAVDTARRAVDWRFGAERPIFRPPAVAGSLIAAVDEGRTIYCLNADGILNWSYRADGPAAADPLWLGPQLIVALRSGPVIALNAEHPGVIWRAEFENDMVRSTAAWRGRVLCSCRDGWIRVLDARGRPAGAWNVGGPLAGPLTVEEDRVYAGREDGVLCALDARDGSFVWRMRIGGELAAPVVIDGRRLYLSSRQRRAVRHEQERRRHPLVEAPLLAAGLQPGPLEGPRGGGLGLAAPVLFPAARRKAGRRFQGSRPTGRPTRWNETDCFFFIHSIPTPRRER